MYHFIGFPSSQKEAFVTIFIHSSDSIYEISKVRIETDENLEGSRNDM